ncbi:conserved hypothetical protein [Leishmania major strain Friedlin]|uniref:Uncharacterized protein n=1 Tax=Leishmania major TaxID=5664 RepID=Q4QC35_LEIMA|nr:conserved hypothetical protein [Leishmania major strain Friedlin]CAG9573595.1 hypothetical_protein_-_conserved [Leishmania major strain Friedlin]CAJ04941.1 conserved hypothetical protein [Leishmania major strain Friedlin]|eukprot:XP_001683113.1 conserved hypothetical protein [Leishmania major strain Friedlin]
MKSVKKTPRGEHHSLVPTTTTTAANSTSNGTKDHIHNGNNAAASRRTSVPLLDEESLKANTASASSGAAGGFTLVPHSDDRLKLSGATISGSPPSQPHSVDNSHIYTMLQQQQAVAMAAAQLEHAYNQTCYLLQQCSHNALLTVLMSLLNDYPTTLVQPIRMRVEQVLAHQMSPSASGRVAVPGRRVSEFVPNSSAAPWTPSNMRGSAAPTPTTNSTTPSHRRGRGHKGKEEEQEICSIHNNLRAMKHLQLNVSTGLYECIHGFHCLVDGPTDASPKRLSTASAVSPSTSASRANGPAPSADSQPFAPPPTIVSSAAAESRFSMSEVEALRMLGYPLPNTNSDQPQPHLAHESPRPQPTLQQPHQQFSHASLRSSGLGFSGPSHHDPESSQLANGGGFTVISGDRSSAGTSPLDPRLSMDIPSLEYLLQSVRDIDDD